MYDTNTFLKLEEEFINEELFKGPQLSTTNSIIPTDKEIMEAHRIIHNRMINSLISCYMSHYCMSYTVDKFHEFFEGELRLLDFDITNLDLCSIPHICEELHIVYLNTQYSYKNGKLLRCKSKTNLLETGSVYTQDKIAYDIVYRTLKNIQLEDNHSIKVLDFATGTGRFYKQVVICLEQLFNIQPDDSILKNIYAVDVDPVAVNICRINALSQLSNLDLIKAITIKSHIILKNALLKEEIFENEMAISHNDSDGLYFNGFHAIVSNPPYLVLKPNKKKMDAATVESINNMAKYFRNSPFYKYSIEGMLNLYQLSLEAMLGMLKQSGEMGIICPSTLFADISAASLRKHLLSKNNITYIKYFSEDDPLFDNVTQATCIFHLTKGGDYTRY